MKGETLTGWLRRSNRAPNSLLVVLLRLCVGLIIAGDWAVGSDVGWQVFGSFMSDATLLSSITSCALYFISDAVALVAEFATCSDSALANCCNIALNS